MSHGDAEPKDPLLRDFHTAGSAAVIESIYTGIERLLATVAREIDGCPIEKDEAWHRALIERMSHPYGDRTAVLSPATTELMNVLRGFRHKVRRSYSTALDAAIVHERAYQALALAGQIAADIHAFLASRDKALGL